VQTGEQQAGREHQPSLIAHSPGLFSFLVFWMAEKAPHPTSLRIPPDLKEFLKRQALASNRKLAGQIIHILKEWRAMAMRVRAK